MAHFIFSISNPSIPGTIRVDHAETDPRELISMNSSTGQSQRIDWIVRVSDVQTSLVAIDEVLSHYRDPSWPGHYRCAPALARSVAIEFAASEGIEHSPEIKATALPSLVLGLGLAVQFLGLTNGQAGLSAALIAAALFWVVYSLPVGTRGREQAQHGKL